MVIKADGYNNDALRINRSGGSINIQGTEASPIVFTSLNDDSVAGDTGGDGATIGTINNYGSAVSINADGSLLVSNAKVRHANTAFALGYGQADIEGTDVSQVTKGLDVVNAKVIFRGTMDNASSKAITACGWASQACSVDAAYTDWGSSSGPTGKVCGKVTTSPWVCGNARQSGQLFTPNCDNSLTPQDSMTANISYFQQRVASRLQDCDNGFQSACDAYHQAYICLQGTISVANSTSPWPIPPASTDEEVDAFGSQVIDGATSYIEAHESITVGQFSFAIAAELSKVIPTMLAISNAYSSCTP